MEHVISKESFEAIKQHVRASGFKTQNNNTTKKQQVSPCAFCYFSPFSCSGRHTTCPAAVFFSYQSTVDFPTRGMPAADSSFLPQTFRPPAHPDRKKSLKAPFRVLPLPSSKVPCHTHSLCNTRYPFQDRLPLPSL